MAIPDSGAPYVYTQLDASSKTALIEALKQALIDSDWTLKQSDSASVTVTFTGLPANGNTVTFDGVVYTFRTAITQENPREVDIGADAAECASNLADAINAEAGTSGTAYSNSTTAHPTCTASASTTACTVYGANGFTASETLANATLNRTTAIGLGYKLDSARCPSGLQMRLMLDDDGNATMIRIRVASCDETAVLSGAWRLTADPGRLLEFIGCKHEVWTYLAGSAATQGCNFHCGTPALKDKNVPPKIASISDNGGLFQITTTTPHGGVTGEHVHIAGGTVDSGAGVSAINGDHQITVLDSLNYTLDASTYAAESYDADSGLSGTTSLAARAFWVEGDDTQSRPYSFRNSLGATALSGGTYGGVCYNQYSYTLISNSLLRLKRPVCDDVASGSVKDLGGMDDAVEAQIAWPLTAPTAEIRTVGMLWNAFVIAAPHPMDKPKHNYMGFNWTNYTNNSAFAASSLWLVTTPAV